LYVECRKDPPFQRLDGKNWTDNDDSLTSLWLQHRRVRVNSRLAAEAVQVIARENRFHPVRDYLRSIQWDQQPRLHELLPKYFGAESTEWTRAIGERWLISAVARIERPGCQVDHVLLIQGPQGRLKSTALRTLAGDDHFSDHISDLGSKDSRVDLHGKWILEMAELDKVRRGQLERVKAFLTARIDNFRLPYGRISEAVPRSCVFAATVNDETPLTDETGGRRFWPVGCGTIDIEALERDRDQLWAEAYQRYYDGAVWWLDSAELNTLAAEEQDKRYEPGVWDDIILEWIEEPRQGYETDGANLPLTPFDSKPRRVTVTDILIHGIRKPLDRLTQNDRMQVVRCLVHAGWKRWQSGEKAHRGRWFYVPSL
jgi:predicted P-loop ATPase